MSALKRSRSRSCSQSLERRKRPAPELRRVALFIFRRDLRLYDNSALARLVAATSLPILPVFFFNPVQMEPKKNPYFGRACFQFMCESLTDLDKQLEGRLVCLKGSDATCLATIRRCGFAVEAVGYNADFTPFALQRDAQLEEWCDAQGVTEVLSSDTDFSLLPLDRVENKSGQPYSVFTPFYRCVMAEHVRSIPKPVEALVHSVEKTFVADAKEAFESHLVTPADLYTPMEQLADRGGRTVGLARLQTLPAMKHYEVDRDDIAGDKTSHLSPHLKFGTVSSREVWAAAVAALGSGHAFVRQLIWREFYAMLLYNHPRLAQGQLQAFEPKESGKKPAKLNAPFLAKYDRFDWRWEEEHWRRFQQGNTGVPLVDAAVRCLNATGWCHNRCRMVIASFLVKVLSVDWRVGERWFATVSVDFDVANNNGGWLWSSGQGADPQPYFRSFNPYRQSQRFDEDCVFIYQWVPELRGVPPKVVHGWDVYCAKRDNQKRRKESSKASSQKKPLREYDTTYPPPMVDVAACTKKVIATFKKYDPVK